MFNPDGTFVRELFIEKETLGAGSVWDIAFSHDGEQKYLYVADGVNEKVYIVDRKSLTLISSFGNGGRQPGQFYGTHNVAVDSHGNIYTTETFEGKRLQKFVYKGEGPIRTPHQGVPLAGRLTSTFLSVPSRVRGRPTLPRTRGRIALFPSTTGVSARLPPIAVQACPARPTRTRAAPPVPATPGPPPSRRKSWSSRRGRTPSPCARSGCRRSPGCRPSG